MTCSCPQGPGRTITDPERHAAWHTLVHQQTGLDTVTAATLQTARGIGATPPTRIRTIPQPQAASYDEWLPLFILAVRNIPAGAEFTTADLHGKVPQPAHPNWWGKAQAHVHKLHLVRPVTTQTSELETTRQSLVRRWQRIAQEVAA